MTVKITNKLNTVVDKITEVLSRIKTIFCSPSVACLSKTTSGKGGLEISKIAISHNKQAFSMEFASINHDGNSNNVVLDKGILEILIDFSPNQTTRFTRLRQSWINGTKKYISLFRRKKNLLVPHPDSGAILDLLECYSSIDNFPDIPESNQKLHKTSLNSKRRYAGYRPPLKATLSRAKKYERIVNTDLALISHIPKIYHKTAWMKTESKIVNHSICEIQNISKWDKWEDLLNEL